MALSVAITNARAFEHRQLALCRTQAVDDRMASRGTRFARAGIGAAMKTADVRTRWVPISGRGAFTVSALHVVTSSTQQKTALILCDAQ